MYGRHCGGKQISETLLATSAEEVGKHG